MTPFFRRAALIASACVVPLCSCAVPSRESPDVILVTWDTVRWDHVGAFAQEDPDASPTPTFDRLSSEGVMFLEARTPEPITLPAHASIHTGLFPPAHGARDNGSFRVRPGIPLLAERFRAAGYRTGAFVSAVVLARRYGLDRGFEVYDDAISEDTGPVAERRGNLTVDAAIRWIQSVPGRDPLFLWLHLYDPHRDWDAPESFARRFDPYRAEIAFTDSQTARLLEAVQERGRLGNAIVAIASDHGEGLGEHGEETHAYFAYDSTLRVPLLLWAGPDVVDAASWKRGARIRGPVSLVDLAPTLAAIAGLEPEPTDGRSLAPFLSGAPIPAEALPFECTAPALHFDTAPIFGVLDANGESWIDLPRRERYDLRRDPGQLHNLYRVEDAPRADAIFERFDRDWPPGDESRLEVEESSRRDLEALGYVSLPSDDLTRANIDPKDRLELAKFVSVTHIAVGPARALERIAELRTQYGPLRAFDELSVQLLDTLGRSVDAIQMLEEIDRRDPSHHFRDEIERRRRELDEQRQLATNIRAAIAEGRAPETAQRDLALTLHRLQEWNEARAIYRAELERAPGDEEIRLNLVRILMGEDEVSTALAVLEEGLAQPDATARLHCTRGRILAINLHRLDEAKLAFAKCRAGGGKPNAQEMEALRILTR